MAYLRHNTASADLLYVRGSRECEEIKARELNNNEIFLTFKEILR